MEQQEHVLELCCCLVSSVAESEEGAVEDEEVHWDWRLDWRSLAISDQMAGEGADRAP